MYTVTKKRRRLCLRAAQLLADGKMWTPDGALSLALHEAGEVERHTKLRVKFGAMYPNERGSYLCEYMPDASIGVLMLLVFRESL